MKIYRLLLSIAFFVGALILMGWKVFLGLICLCAAIDQLTEKEVREDYMD